MKTTVTTLQNMKAENKKIAMLTCYDYSTAKLMDEAGVDTILEVTLLEIQCLVTKIQSA